MSSTAWPVDLNTVTAAVDGRPARRAEYRSELGRGGRITALEFHRPRGWRLERRRRLDDEEAPFDRRRGEFAASTYRADVRSVGNPLVLDDGVASVGAAAHDVGPAHGLLDGVDSVRLDVRRRHVFGLGAIAGSDADLSES